MRRRRLFAHLQSSLWFVPVLCVLAGPAISFATIALDRAFGYEAVPSATSILWLLALGFGVAIAVQAVLL